MKYNYIKEEYFKPLSKSSSVSVKDTKEQMECRRMNSINSAISEFKNLVGGTGSEEMFNICIAADDWKKSQTNRTDSYIEVCGKYKIGTIVDGGEAVGIDELDNPVVYIFYTAVDDCISGRPLQIFKYKDEDDYYVSIEPKNTIFRLEPTLLKSKLKFGSNNEFRDFIIPLSTPEIKWSNSKKYRAEVTCNVLGQASEYGEWLSTSSIDPNGISVEFVYTPIIAVGIQYISISWIDALISAMAEEIDTDKIIPESVCSVNYIWTGLDNSLKDIFRNVMHTEFETAKSESRKPSLRNIIITAADTVFGKSVKQVAAALRDDLKIISDALSNNQPMYEMTYGCQIPVTLTAKFRLSGGRHEDDCKKKLNLILNQWFSGVFAESVNDFLDENENTILPI